MNRPPKPADTPRLPHVATCLVHCLEAYDVAYVFGVPGEETLDVLDALRCSSVRFVATRHEQGAAFMAATVGRLTGIPGVALTTLGPGALNAMTGMAYAFLGQMPLMLLTGQKPIDEVKQGNFQMIDVVASMQPVTLLSQQLTQANATASSVYQALHLSASYPHGPVHLELAEDVAKRPVDADFAALAPPMRGQVPVAREADIAAIAQLINQANMPLLICGQHAQRVDVAHALAGLVKQVGLNFASTQMGKGVLDEESERYIGTTALSDDDFVHRATAAADLIIMVGHNESEKPPWVACCHEQTLIHVNDVQPVLNETYLPTHALSGDLAASINALATQLQPVDASGFSAYRQAFRDHEHDLVDSAEPLQIVQQVRQAMPDHGIVTLDNGMYKIWFARHYRTRQPNTLLLDNALATMGAGLPSAIAAKLVHRDRPVLAVCGDGGFVMGGQDFETAIRLNLDLVVLILRDEQYGMIRWKQEMDGYPDFGLDFGNPDFAALAQSYGANGWRLEQVSELASRIEECQRTGGVHIIEMPIDYNANGIFARIGEISAQFAG